MRHLRAIVYKIIVMILLFLGTLVFLLRTTPGAYMALNTASLFLPGRLHVQHLSGNLANGLSITELTDVDANVPVHLTHGDLHFKMTMHPWNISLVLNHAQMKRGDQAIDVQAEGQLLAPYALTASLHLARNSKGLGGEMQITGDSTSYRGQGLVSGLLPIPITFMATLCDFNQLNARASVGPNHLSLTGLLSSALQLKVSVPQASSLHPALVGLTTDVQASGTFQGLNQGEMTIKIAPGHYQPAVSPIAFQGGTVMIHITPKALDATGAFVLDSNQQFKMSLQLPEFDWQKLASLTQPMTGLLDLQVNSLDFLKGLSPVISHPEGKLSAQLNVTGTLGAPDIQGVLALKEAGVTIPEMGLSLHSMQATLNSHNEQWVLTGTVFEQDGQALKWSGQGSFSPHLTGKILLNADHFPILKTAEYAIDASPQLTVNILPNALDITGTIGIPSARFKPMVFSNTLNVTGDAVFVQDSHTSAPGIMPIQADIRVQLGDDVLIDTQGLHGLLRGELQLKQSLEGAMSAVGELTIREGHYRAYGQDLAVDHGQLLFTGGALNNPTIGLRAVRSFNNTSQFSGSNQLFDFNASNIQPIVFGNHVTVGVDVSGYLNAPKIKLFSVPSSLSQADILSLLLLGKPANQASQSGGKLLMTAMSAMNLDSGTKGMQLLTQLKDALGVDFDVQSRPSTSNSTASDTSVVLGKSLSKRLYLSYNVGVFQENSNVLTLKYLLNRYFSVQVTTNNVGNGLDLLYTASP